MTEKNTPIFPAPEQTLFSGGIIHPKLWLWDSWCFESNGVLHLYCLALSRKNTNGRDIYPYERNQYPFHIRHFTSDNFGREWKDCGMFQSLSLSKDSYYSRNVWSGSVKPHPNNGCIVAFTGIRLMDSKHDFLQSIGIGFSLDGYRLDSVQESPLSCPLRDYEEIIKTGYYLGDKNKLGANSGEDGGPIMAWRDPFVFIDDKGEIHLFWSAKISARQGAIAHAKIKMKNNEFIIKKLYPPIKLPDGEEITQAEVPKIIYDRDESVYYMLISACDRISEDQPDNEINKTTRLYKSKSLREGWEFYKKNTSIIPGLENCFGASIVRTDFDNKKLHLICPITEKAEAKWQLSIAPIKTISLK